MERLNKWNANLNILIASFIGVFIASSIYRYYDYKKYLGLYEMQSVAWYTSIQVYALATLIIIFLAIILKLLIKKKLENN